MRAIEQGITAEEIEAKIAADGDLSSDDELDEPEQMGTVHEYLVDVSEEAWWQDLVSCWTRLEQVLKYPDGVSLPGIPLTLVRTLIVPNSSINFYQQKVAQRRSKPGSVMHASTTNHRRSTPCWGSSLPGTSGGHVCSPSAIALRATTGH